MNRKPDSTMDGDDFIHRSTDTPWDGVHESVAAFEEEKGKEPGEYTREDYDEISREFRVELIDGVLYEMEAPDSIHQVILARLWSALDSFIHQNKGTCLALFSPLDVQLDEDDKTVVQPDIVIVCDREKIIRTGIYGAPDLVVEILSRSTARRDMTLKTDKYAQAGVREYWLVNPDKKQILVYDFEEDASDSAEAPFVSLYGFEEQVPVRIFGGKCQVDFQKIYDAIAFLYD